MKPRHQETGLEALKRLQDKVDNAKTRPQRHRRLRQWRTCASEIPLETWEEVLTAINDSGLQHACATAVWWDLFADMPGGTLDKHPGFKAIIWATADDKHGEELAVALATRFFYPRNHARKLAGKRKK